MKTTDSFEYYIQNIEPLKVLEAAKRIRKFYIPIYFLILAKRVSGPDSGFLHRLPSFGKNGIFFSQIKIPLFGMIRNVAENYSKTMSE